MAHQVRRARLRRQGAAASGQAAQVVAEVSQLGDAPVQVGGPALDPFAGADDPVGLSCRIYRSATGVEFSPTVDQLRSVLTGGS